MRYVSVEKLKPGDILASTVFDSKGICLLHANVELQPAYLSRLKGTDILGVYIYDDLTTNINISDGISHKTLNAIYNVLKRKDYDGCMLMANSMVEELVDRIDEFPNMGTLSTVNDKIFQHSLRVSLMATQIAIELEKDIEFLRDAATAGLLHDIGCKEIAEECGTGNKPSRSLMLEHMQRGYDILKRDDSIKSVVRHAVLCHHENYDGTGFPDGRNVKQLTELDLLIHLCAEYDHMIDDHSMNPADAWEFILGNSGTMFAPEQTVAFSRCIFPYITGTDVRLSDGRKAVIAKNIRGFSLRPNVITEDGEEISLMEQRNIVITESLR